MILFEEDWKKYPNAIIDYKTNNQSAIDLATKLRQMGVSNNVFFLALHDPSIQGLDPFDPNLTLDQMVLIGKECRVNPWYILREIARAPATAGLVSSKVEFNRSIICVWWCFFNGVTLILTQLRQTGKSFAVDSLMNSVMNFLSNNTKINLLTLSEKLRTETVGRIKAIYEELPPYLKFKTRHDLNNTEEMTVNKFNNRYRTHIAQASPKAAYNLGRGLTTPLLHVDEPPFQPNISVALDACLPAMDAAVDYAKKVGALHGTIYTTTAGKKDEPSGKYMYAMIKKSVLWTEKLYDCSNKEDLENVLKANKGVYRIYAEFNHRQLGKTDEWLKEKLSERAMSPDAIMRDYFNVWTSGTMSSPLATALLEKMAKSVVPEEHIDISKIGSYITRWYVPEAHIKNYMRDNKVIIGLDTSDAAGNDDIGFIGVDVETGATVFSGNYNDTNLITFSKWLASWLEEYPNCVLIPERRSSAVVIIDYLLELLPQKGIDPFKRIFNWVINNPMEHKERYAETRLPLHRRSSDIYVRCKKYFGFATSGSGETSRSELYSNTLQNAAKRCYDRIHDKPLFEQISGLVIRNGRVDHEIGSNDDMVISWLLTHWLLTMGKNLTDYDIDASKVLSKITREEKSDPVSAFQRTEQMRIRNRIFELYELLKNETDDNMCQRYEMELIYLDKQIILGDNEHFSVDEVIRSARETNSFSKPVYNDINHRYTDIPSDLPEGYVLG